MELRTKRIIDIPTADVGEVFVTREVGAAQVVITAKIPIMKGFWEKLGATKIEKGRMGKAEFPAFSLSPEIRGRFCQRNRYSVLNSSNPLVDEENGVSPLLTFLRHTGLPEGVEIPIDYPVNPETFADDIGEGLSAFITDFLVPFKAGFRFYFERI